MAVGTGPSGGVLAGGGGGEIGGGTHHVLWHPAMQEVVDLVVQGNHQVAGDAQVVNVLDPG